MPSLKSSEDETGEAADRGARIPWIASAVRVVHPGLVLLADRLGVGLAVRIEAFLVALLPSGFELGRRDVPIRPALPGDRAQILAEILGRWAAEEPIAIIDLVNDEIRLEHNRMRDHRVVDRIGVFGDVQILLDGAPRVGEKRPVGAGSATKFIRLDNAIGAYCDEPAIADLHLAMELNKALGLSAIFGT